MKLLNNKPVIPVLKHNQHLQIYLRSYDYCVAYVYYAKFNWDHSNKLNLDYLALISFLDDIV